MTNDLTTPTGPIVTDDQVDAFLDHFVPIHNRRSKLATCGCHAYVTPMLSVCDPVIWEAAREAIKAALSAMPAAEPTTPEVECNHSFEYEMSNRCRFCGLTQGEIGRQGNDTTPEPDGLGESLAHHVKVDAFSHTYIGMRLDTHDAALAEVREENRANIEYINNVSARVTALEDTPPAVPDAPLGTDGFPIRPTVRALTPAPPPLVVDDDLVQACADVFAEVDGLETQWRSALYPAIRAVLDHLATRVPAGDTEEKENT